MLMWTLLGFGVLMALLLSGAKAQAQCCDFSCCIDNPIPGPVTIPDASGDSSCSFTNSIEEIFGVKLTPAQIANVAANAGFQGDDLITAVAVALAESGGNPKAYNPETAAGTPVGLGSYGLWQVYLKAHPEFGGVDLYDPSINADAAFQVYTAAGGFRPWSTFTNGMYAAHVDAATAAVSA